MATTKNVKRSLRTISAHGKLEAIRRVHDGESKASVARDIGVPESTLRGWCKNETKISYLSRQSSPETDESIEPKDKRPKIEESAAMVQPFNLSLKSPASHLYTPSSESLYTPIDYVKIEPDCTPKTPQNLSIKTETPKSTASQVTERERNRAELARLSVELGLNRPEMPTNNTGNLTELATNITLLNQWNNIIMQHQLGGIQAQNGHTSKKHVPTPDVKPVVKPPKEQQSMEEYVNCWLKAQEAMLTNSPKPSSSNSNNGLSPTPLQPPSNPTMSNLNGVNVQSSWFWNWYKQLSFAPPGEKQILYHQLTKDTNEVENLSMHNNNSRTKSVLDNLLLINNNNITVAADKVKDNVISYGEALEHGEKFLKWLETYSNPSVTAMQIMQFRSLLNNVKTSVDRKNGELQHKTKVRRK